jgi:HTH-type transcriptional regulator/antitoxin HigA
MNKPFAILNEREARETKTAIAEITRALSSKEYFATIIAGLPTEVVNGYRRALSAQKAELKAMLEAYENAKAGQHSELQRRAGNDPGSALIVARIIRGYSQKEFARRVGLKEQQIQRYEADQYRAISLANFKRLAYALGARLELYISDERDPWWRGGQDITRTYSAAEIKKIIKHAKDNGWFEGDNIGDVDNSGSNYLQYYISRHILDYGSPALFRTGINVEDVSEDLDLIAWKARVTRLAENIIGKQKLIYSGLDISWLQHLVHLSQHDNGPALARDYLLERGIVLVVESQIPGLKLDGAAFLVGGTPVISLTLRRDTIDNFWFTLLHEVAHIVLHYRMGLDHGFFDDTERAVVDEIEQEANYFAGNMLIPNERWKRSAARLSKTAAPIEKFAAELGIHPAIVFGRIQKERGDYAIFSEKLGRGLVRKWLI